MKVFVVMGNDYPEAVFSSCERAEEFCEHRKESDAKVGRAGRIFWRYYEFELDKREW